MDFIGEQTSLTKEEEKILREYIIKKKTKKGKKFFRQSQNYPSIELIESGQLHGWV